MQRNDKFHGLHEEMNCPAFAIIAVSSSVVCRKYGGIEIVDGVYFTICFPTDYEC